MAAERASSTGVKSLRAMFESNKLEGDSPGKTAGAAGIGADKPLAKVRTAFVEVELSAKLMRKMRDNVDGGKENDEHVAGKLDGGRRNGTNGLAQAPDAAAQLLPVVLGNTVAETAARGETKKADPINSTKPTARTVPPKSSSSNLRNTHDALSTLQRPSINPRTTSRVEPKAESKPHASANQKPDNDTRLTENGPAKTIRAMPSNSRLGALKVEKTRNATSPALKAQSKVLNDLSTPPLSKSRSREVLSTHRAPATPAATPSTAAPAARAKPAGVRSATGFLKPRPKSPTRPVQLPAHLVAHTSSSAAKFGVVPPPPPVPQPQTHHHRPPATQSAPASRRASNISATSARPLVPAVPAVPAPTRKASTFGPPPKPKPAGGGHSGAAVVRPPDDFLARMMRPTASSSSKVRVVDAAAASPRVRPRVARKVPSRLSINESASASASNSEANTTLSSTTSPLRAVREDGAAGLPPPPLDAGTPPLAGRRDEIPSSPPLDAVLESLDAVVGDLQD